MKQKFIQQPPQFKWFAWLPYPISWLRALVLVPIAFPVARLIVLGFTGTAISAIGNILVVLVFCLVFGLFLPTIVLSFPYHFFLFIWQQPSPIHTSKWMPNSESLWEAFCATVVTGLSFISILAIFTSIGFLICQLQLTTEEIGSCVSKIIGEVAGSIFGATDEWHFNNSGVITRQQTNFAVQPWFVIWLIVAAYLYQLEYLIKQRFIPWLRVGNQKYKFLGIISRQKP